MRRTFTTPDDFFALTRRIQERGEWIQFEEYAFVKWNGHEDHFFIPWLLDPARFAELVAQWLEEKL